MHSEIFQLIKKDPHTWSLANLLSLSRLLFLPLICWAITLQTHSGNVLALLFLALSGATDFLDGYLARRLDQRSFLGRILDPLLDKITVGVTLLFLAAYRQLPYWYVFLVIARDVLILTAAASLVKHIKAVAESNYLGKWTLGSFLIVIMTYILNWSPYQLIALWVSSLLVPATLFSYLKKFWQLLQTDQN
ncbi:CDP-alcohol phosphatidyltransferase family protein [bacterium]|nr:CDP-alcohol phosphatidyltransferase family protein [bacterium]